MGHVRRLYLSVVAGVSLAVWATGAVLLLRQLVLAVWDAATGVVLFAGGTVWRQQLGVSLALVLVGLPVWALHWSWIERISAREPAERRSVVRALYQAVVLAVTFSTWIRSAVAVLAALLRAMLGAEGVSDVAPLVQDGVPALLVSGGVWWFHRRWLRIDCQLAERRGAAAWIPQLYWYSATGTGLTLLVVGVALLLRAALDAVLPATVLVGSLHTAVSRALALSVSGLVAWGLHWPAVLQGTLDAAPADQRRSAIHWGYLTVVVFASLATLLAALTVVLQVALGWIVGVSDGDTVARTRQILQPLTWLLPALLVWWYHRAVLRHEAAVNATLQPAGTDWFTNAGRVLRYGSAFVALLFAGLGLSRMVSLLVDALFALLVSQPVGSWRRDLAFGLAVAGSGSGAWLVFWRAILASWARDPSGERSSLSRRAYLYATLGVSVLALLGSAASVLARLLSWLLGAESAAVALTSSAPALGIMLVALMVLAYHGQVLRRDLREAGAAPAAGATVRLVLRLPPGSDPEGVVQELAAHLPPGAQLERR
ncbi:DUF5671 domain-containing protein [Thermorudis peleae]|uniref:DUF5671 domain-containing protein n=1 Tax=Thermorudis peleae TaxID=1382356 RepID=UPI0005703CA1|nr:DUF5671 domain-containing protein [Thermorudis peleae]